MAGVRGVMTMVVIQIMGFELVIARFRVLRLDLEDVFTFSASIKIPFLLFLFLRCIEDQVTALVMMTLHYDIAFQTRSSINECNLNDAALAQKIKAFKEKLQSHWIKGDC